MKEFEQHSISSLYTSAEPETAHRLAIEWLEIHYTPKHTSVL
jgi:hypothetical protein